MKVDARALVEAAMKARQGAYAPYSGYHVGAAALGASGRVYSGVNVENSSYGLSVCAERVAILKAISEGEREIAALAVATENGATPCGACRQVLYEFGPTASILLSAVDGTRKELVLDDLLPDAFTLKR
jgi:cytidine deaminase